MLAVILTRHGIFVKIMGLVNTEEEVDEIANALIEKHDLVWLNKNGYSLNVVEV